MASVTVPRPSAADEIATILASPEVSALVAELNALRWTGRRGYGCRALLGACIAKSLYNIATWSRVAALIREHTALAEAIGGTPSVYAMYRFAAKLRLQRPMIEATFDRIAASLREVLPEYGVDIAIDASDMPAFANGQRFVRNGGPERERFSDPEASWGHRSAVSTRKGGGFYGWKIDAAVCTRTGLPLAWEVRTAKIAELHAVPTLLDTLKARGFAVATMTADKGYDYGPVHDACMTRGVVPVIARRKFAGEGDWTEHPICEHGDWTFAGADFKRNATKWRCPTGECSPKSVWVKADRRHPLIPRGSRRFGELYRGRAAVEREFGWLKHSHGLATVRVRGLDRVRLHADLCILTRLATALVRARSVPLAA